MTLLLTAVAVAFLTALALSAMVARTGPVDPVKMRSSHDAPTPTSGGLAVIAATTLGAGLAPVDTSMTIVIAVAALLGVFGAVDDVNDFPAGLKFVAQVVAAALIVAMAAHVTELTFAPGLILSLPLILGAIGSGLFLVLLLNAMNFMDGADRLAGGAALIALVTLGVAAMQAEQRGLGYAAFAGAGANAGFLVLNRRRVLFQGDAGAFFSALMIGGLGLLLAQRGAATPWLVLFAVLPLLIDVLLTLVVRARRRERLTEAHREHLYQVWLRATRRPHTELAPMVWLITAACCATGLALERWAPEWSFAGLVVSTMALSLGWVLVRRRYAARLTA